MKKILIVLGLISLVSLVEARPGPGPGRGPRPGQTMYHQRPPSRPFPGQSFHRPPPRHHHHSTWGRGGRNFWPGFVGGVVGGMLYDGFAGPTVVTTPTTVVVPQSTVVVPQTTVISQPVYETRSVWVDGTYVDQIQPDGRVLKVWTPGHYETRKVPIYY